jgi:hypothetical protein
MPQGQASIVGRVRDTNTLRSVAPPGPSTSLRINSRGGCPHVFREGRDSRTSVGWNVVGDQVTGGS